MSKPFRLDYDCHIDLSQITAIEKPYPRTNRSNATALVIRLKGTELVIHSNKFDAYTEVLEAWTEYLNQKSKRPKHHS